MKNFLILVLLIFASSFAAWGNTIGINSGFYKDVTISVDKVIALKDSVFECAQSDSLRTTGIVDVATLSAIELQVLASTIKRERWPLETYGPEGINEIQDVFFSCLYELGKREDGVPYLVALLKQKDMGWDGCHSLSLTDVFVKCGKRALPVLKELEADYYIASRSIALIKEGARTAF